MVDSYRAPPIIEAVIELQFADAVPFETIQKKIARFGRHYPRHDINIDFQAHFSPEEASLTQSPAGYRFRNQSELEVLVLQIKSLGVAQLAPYPGWGAFRGRFVRDYEAHQDQFGRKSVARVGIRFINRIDIPQAEVVIPDYLSIFPMAPNLGNSIGLSFAIETTRQLEDARYNVTLRASTVQSPVPQMISFMLDIDLFRQVELPQRQDHLLAMLDEMRDIKNYIFEASITDKTRELFR